MFTVGTRSSGRGGRKHSLAPGRAEPTPLLAESNTAGKGQASQTLVVSLREHFLPARLCAEPCEPPLAQPSLAGTVIFSSLQTGRAGPCHVLTHGLPWRESWYVPCPTPSDPEPGRARTSVGRGLIDPLTPRVPSRPVQRSASLSTEAGAGRSQRAIAHLALPFRTTTFWRMNSSSWRPLRKPPTTWHPTQPEGPAASSPEASDPATDPLAASS